MFIVYLVIAAILINLIVPYVLKPFATPEEITPQQGAASLSFKSQLMHMFVHHAQVPFSSSIIIAIIVATAFYLATTFENMTY